MEFQSVFVGQAQHLVLENQNNWNAIVQGFGDNATISFEGNASGAVADNWHSIVASEIDDAGNVVQSGSVFAGMDGVPTRRFQGVKGNNILVRVRLIEGISVSVGMEQDEEIQPLPVWPAAEVQIPRLSTRNSSRNLSDNFFVEEPNVPRRRSSRSQYGAEVETQTLSKLPGVMEYYDNLVKSEKSAILKKKKPMKFERF